MSKKTRKKNPVAKHINTFNKPKVFIDKKKESKKNPKEEEDDTTDNRGSSSGNA